MPKSMDLGDFSIVKLHNAIFSLIRRNFPIMLKFQYRKEVVQVGRKLIPKEVRDLNDLRDQLIDALQKKNTVQEEMIAAQDELIAQLTEEIQTFKETLRVVRENQQLEKELDK